MLGLAAVAFLVGAIVGSHHGTSPSRRLADQFVQAWVRGDYASMYSDIDERSRHETSAHSFAADYRQAMRTATATRIRISGQARALTGAQVTVPVLVQTRLFGTLSLQFTMKIADGSEGPRVLWSRSLSFPGLRPGELLSRNIALPPRADVLARDGSVLAEGSAQAGSGETTRFSPLGAAADAVIGTVGPVPASRRAELEAEGVPAGATVGLSGLERALDDRLRGRPGGALLAGRRLLAYVAPRAAPPVRSSISPALQREAVTALGGALGGIVAMAPATGQILAVAGLGLDGLQPPGSTFKMVTLSGVLAAKLATPQTVFPYATYATLDGVKLNNANGEECGGSLELAFAVSCNSVFTPLGVKLGAPRLVAMAERFGFNSEPGVDGAAESSLPAASEIQGELDLGSTAIGQGRVLATPLEMATVAASIADGGRRPQPTFLAGARSSRQTFVTSSAVAHTVRHMMTGVVRYGTGRSAAIPGVVVAGKTGTAELKTACTPSEAEASAPEAEKEAKEGETKEQKDCASGENEASNTDAWFAAFAPARHPRIVVCVLLVKDGAGGDTAAPLAREVLEEGLRETAH